MPKLVNPETMNRSMGYQVCPLLLPSLLSGSNDLGPGFHSQPIDWRLHLFPFRNAIYEHFQQERGRLLIWTPDVCNPRKKNKLHKIIKLDFCFQIQINFVLFAIFHPSCMLMTLFTGWHITFLPTQCRVKRKISRMRTFLYFLFWSSFF